MSELINYRMPLRVLRAKADKYGFTTHDDREISVGKDMYFECEDCQFQWIYELRAWMLHEHMIMVTDECYNYTSFGWKIMDCSVEFDKAAPILDESGEPEFFSLYDAMVAGLLMAFHIMEENERKDS